MTYRYTTLRDLERSLAHTQLTESQGRATAVRDADPELFARVAKVLFECDPVGINFDSNTDEYESEAGTIIPRLQTAKGIDEVEAIVYDELLRWFGPAVIRPTMNVRGCAEGIWGLRAHFQGADPVTD